MKRSSIDTVLEVRLRHEPGTLARVATAIASEGGLLCEIETLRIGDEHTLRDITVETDTVADVDRVVAAVKSVDGAEVLATRDRVMNAHRGGKIRVASRLPLDSVRDLRTIGLGAAGTAIAALVKHFGVADVVGHDPDHAASARAARLGARLVAFDELLAVSDVVIAATGRARLIDPSHVRHGQIVLALSNPDPEIDPKRAIAAGAAIASDGRAINNALAFPGLMRGAIEARSSTISSDMMIEAARVIASRAERGELVPTPLSRELHDAVATGVARCAEATRLANTAST